MIENIESTMASDGLRQLRHEQKRSPDKRIRQFAECVFETSQAQQEVVGEMLAKLLNLRGMGTASAVELIVKLMAKGHL